MNKVNFVGFVVCDRGCTRSHVGRSPPSAVGIGARATASSNYGGRGSRLGLNTKKVEPVDQINFLGPF